MTRGSTPTPSGRSDNIVMLLLLVAVTAAVLQLIAFCGRNVINHKPAPPQRPAACTGITIALKLATQRLAYPSTADAGRDIAVVIAPWVATCTGRQRHQTELDGLAVSTDAAADVRIIRRILDEIQPAQPVERP